MRPLAPPVELNRSVPFVDAVFRCMEGAASVEPAVAILLEAERLHGVTVLGEPYSQSFDCRHEIKPEYKPVSLRDAITMCRDQETFPFYFSEAIEQTDAWEDATLFPFITELHFILSGEDFANDFAFLAPGPTVAAFSWRHWGEVTARWANHCWHPRPGHKPTWRYVDFYMRHHAEQYITSFAGWSATVRQILDARAALLETS